MPDNFINTWKNTPSPAPSSEGWLASSWSDIKRLVNAQQPERDAQAVELRAGEPGTKKLDSMVNLKPGKGGNKEKFINTWKEQESNKPTSGEGTWSSTSEKQLDLFKTPSQEQWEKYMRSRPSHKDDIKDLGDIFRGGAEFAANGVVQFLAGPFAGVQQVLINKVKGKDTSVGDSYLEGYAASGDLLPHNKYADKISQGLSYALKGSGEKLGNWYKDTALKAGYSEEDAWKFQGFGNALPEAVVALLGTKAAKKGPAKVGTTLKETLDAHEITPKDIAEKAQELQEAKETSPVGESSIVDGLVSQVKTDAPIKMRKMGKKEGYTPRTGFTSELGADAIEQPTAVEPSPRQQVRGLDQSIAHYKLLEQQARSRGKDIDLDVANNYANKIKELMGKRNELLKNEPVDPAAFLADYRSAGFEAHEQARYSEQMREAERVLEKQSRANRNTSGREIPLDLNPVTGKLEPVSRGLPGATPDTIRDTGAALKSAAEKITAGRSWDMTAEEKIAWRHHRPEIELPPELQGVVQLNTFDPVRAGKEAIKWIAGSLGAELQGGKYTLKTFAALPHDQTDFAVGTVRQALKQPGISGHERALVEGMLPQKGRVTAKELVDGMRLATGDHELLPRETDQHAEVGLDSIGRTEPVQETTTIWQLPENISITTANHFADSRYYGHTRSFIDGDVRKVVEIQSDLEAKARPLSEDKRAATQLRLEELEKNNAQFKRGTEPHREWQDAKMALLQDKVASSAEEAGITPLIKNTHRRLIREELGRAAQAGEPAVHFASADTVAKVEGWRMDKPAHQSLYNRYAGPISKYLEQLGGKLLPPDEYGHTWWEVPTDAAQPIQLYTFNPLKAAEKLFKKEGDLHEALLSVLQQHGEDAARKMEKAYRDLASASAFHNLDEVQREIQGVYGRGQSEEMLFKQNYEAAVKEGLTPEMASRIQDNLDKPHLLEGKEKELYDKYYAPVREMVQKAWMGINKLDPANPLLVDWHGRISADKGFWSRFFSGLTDSTLGNTIAPKPSTQKARSIFQVKGPDGKPVIITQGKDGSVLSWTNKKASMLSPREQPLKPGSTFNGMLVEQVPNQRAIESATGMKFIDDPIFVAGVKAVELRKYQMWLDTLDKVMQSPVWKSMTSSSKNPREGHRRIDHTERLPMLDKVYADPKLAEVLEDFLRPAPQLNSLSGVLAALTNFAIKSFMLIPVKHINNELIHYITESGLTGMAPNPTRAKAIAEATTSVLKQDAFQREIAKHNGSLLYPKTILDGWMQKTMSEQIKKAKADPAFTAALKKAGLAPIEFFEGWSQLSNMGMWATRDILYTARVKEHMAKGMPIAEAIKQVDKFMPTYKLPSRISLFGIGPKQRWVSELLQNKALTVFSRYHHGALSALGNSLKGLKEKGHRMEALNHMAGYAFTLAVLYPLMDAIYQGMTGDKEREVRRAGGLHYLEDAGKVARGEKRVEAAFAAILTPSPVPYAIFQALPGVNTEIYSRKSIRNSADPISLQLLDTAKFVGKQQFNPAGIAPVIESRQSFEDWWLSQLFDVMKIKHPGAEKAQAWEENKAVASFKKRPEWEKELGRNIGTSPIKRALDRLEAQLEEEGDPVKASRLRRRIQKLEEAE